MWGLIAGYTDREDLEAFILSKTGGEQGGGGFDPPPPPTRALVVIDYCDWPEFIEGMVVATQEC